MPSNLDAIRASGPIAGSKAAPDPAKDRGPCAQIVALICGNLEGQSAAAAEIAR